MPVSSQTSLEVFTTTASGDDKAVLSFSSPTMRQTSDQLITPRRTSIHGH